MGYDLVINLSYICQFFSRPWLTKITPTGAPADGGAGDGEVAPMDGCQAPVTASGDAPYHREVKIDVAK